MSSIRFDIVSEEINGNATTMITVRCPNIDNLCNAAANSANDSSSNHIGAIVGGVVGGLIAIGKQTYYRHLTKFTIFKTLTNILFSDKNIKILTIN